jgi:hypothetical protein
MLTAWEVTGIALIRDMLTLMDCEMALINGRIIATWPIALEALVLVVHADMPVAIKAPDKGLIAARLRASELLLPVSSVQSVLFSACIRGQRLRSGTDAMLASTVFDQETNVLELQVAPIIAVSKGVVRKPSVDRHQGHVEVWDGGDSIIRQ